MPTYRISKTFTWDEQVSEKAACAMRMFGLTTEQLAKRVVTHDCTIEINQGDIVYITGPSGAGKSVLLRELEEAIPRADQVNLDEIELPGDKRVIDCVEGDLLTGLKLLSIAGLNDVYCVLNAAGNLSDGQKWRLRLALALDCGKRFVFADEFCCELDRVTAAVIAHNMRKFALKRQVTFILASSHDDILADLAPDVLVIKELSGPAEVIYKQRKK